MAKRKQSRLQGIFQLPDNRDVFGELLLRGPNSLLTLTSRSELPPLQNEMPRLLGMTLDRRKVTCIECLISSPSSSWKENELTHQSVTVFPHFVTVGDGHIDPTSPVVRSVSFTVDDLPFVFHDFDAFGYVTNARSIIDTVLAERRRNRLIETGEIPQVAYFTGKTTIVEINTDTGIFQVSHRPSFNMGGPNGITMKNRMVVTIKPPSPITFTESINRTMSIASFLSVIAGRRQGIYDLQIETAGLGGPHLPPLSVYWSHAPTLHDSTDSYFKPHPGDVPLDPIRRSEEFAAVLQNWMRRDPSWRQSRARYIGCLDKGNYYDHDRLIAAANMFDILPVDAGPPPVALPSDLAECQSVCLEVLKKIPQSIDRDSAISALKRIGKPSLPKKIQYRTAIVQKHFGSPFERLSQIAKIAVQTRNYFVHGRSDDFDYRIVEPFLHFLTDALEFVFAASDLLEAGWDPARWNGERHGHGHTFARFKDEYLPTLAELERAMAAVGKK